MIAQLQSTDWQAIVPAVGYFLLFLIGAIAMQRWWIKKRQTEVPFGKDVRLLRQPGEGQMELFRKFEKNEDVWFVCTASVPMAVTWVMISAFRWFSGYWLLGWALISFLVFATTLLLAMRFLAKKFDEQNNRYLGAFGERYIAECLEPLKQKSWYVFHDVPAEGKRKDFNLDHVVVGPTGVYVIETKTWRKEIGKGIAGASVVYDGKTLRGPRGVNNKPLDQAEANARWLHKLLQSEAKENVSVKPVLTFPEWGVDFDLSAPDKRETRVVISGSLVKFLTTGQRPLTDEQIGKVADVLEHHCRTVKY